MKEITDKFANITTLKLHKPLMVYSTGIVLMGRCEQFRLQRIVDASPGSEMAGLQGMKPNLVTLDKARAMFAGDTKICVPKEEAWKSLREGSWFGKETHPEPRDTSFPHPKSCFDLPLGSPSRYDFRSLRKGPGF